MSSVEVTQTQEELQETQKKHQAEMKQMEAQISQTSKKHEDEKNQLKAKISELEKKIVTYSDQVFTLKKSTSGST